MNIQHTKDRLPFFEVEYNLVDDRFGKIRVHSDDFGPMGVLDYFHGFSEDIREKANDRQAFFVTRLSLTKDVVSSTLENALLYIAACIAEDAGEEVIYCRPPKAAETSNAAHDLWEILGVRKLLDNYDSLVQTV